MKKGVDIQDPLCYTITCREGENKKSQGNAVMRKCRNWQTSKTKDLVSIGDITGSGKKSQEDDLIPSKKKRKRKSGPDFSL